MKRVTTKSLTEIVNDLFNRVEMQFKVDKITVTRFTTDQYESGAVKQIFNCSSPEYSEIIVYCFYSKKEIEENIIGGYKLLLTPPKERYNCFYWELGF